MNFPELSRLESQARSESLGLRIQDILLEKLSFVASEELQDASSED